MGAFVLRVGSDQGLELRPLDTGLTIDRGRQCLDQHLLALARRPLVRLGLLQSFKELGVGGGGIREPKMGQGEMWVRLRRVGVEPTCVGEAQRLRKPPPLEVRAARSVG